MDDDRIEREIHIEAPLERVYELVSEPGWFIGDGDRSVHTFSHERDVHEGDVVVVHDPTYGSFPVRPVAAQPPGYVAFRVAESGQDPNEKTSTLVEFFLTQEPAGTRVRVVESGFAALPLSDEARARSIEDNVEGWRRQLGFAKRDAEFVSG